MREILKSKTIRAMGVVAGVLILVMILSAADPTRQNIFSEITGFVTSPIQKLAAILSGGIDSIGDAMTDADVIRAENDLLTQKVRELTAQMVDYEEVKYENEQLRSLLNMKESLPPFETVGATVISRDATDPYGSFLIDKGRKHGVKYLDPVITIDGLVGYISKVGYEGSRVTTILSPSTNLGAMGRRTRDSGILSGDQDLAIKNLTKLRGLSRDCDVTAGDLAVTTGLGGIYPKNLIIGEVSEIKAEAQDISLFAIIRPAADVKSCIDVFVITYFEGQGSVVNGELNDLTPHIQTSPTDLD
ncbi:MAG: rod shape-determining protein MreC [Oscillospiraceae bacterium]|nr:rod shape-determining protein MreC [Oscillospiraceae bacterium]